MGGLNGQEEDENPLTARFASTYEKYLNGNGEDVAGLIPTYQQLLDGNDTVLGLKQAHQAMLYGGARG